MKRMRSQAWHQSRAAGGVAEGRTLSSKSMPLMADRHLTPGAAAATIAGTIGLRNWWGRQKQTMVAPETAEAMSGSATTFGVNFAPFRYLTFSFVSLMIDVSGLPSIISSCTYIFTSLSKTSCLSALRPRMRTSAEPKLPEPTIAIFSEPAVEKARERDMARIMVSARR